jgi:RimJ/RimL family protein N-acetyltransferase
MSLSESPPSPWLSALETERLLLRTPQPSDLDAMFELHADPIANRFSPSGMLDSREASAALLQSWLDHWQAKGFGFWAIALREQPQQVVGFGGVMNRSVGGVTGLHLYFRFQPQAWGRGLASEMAQQALELAFERLRAPNVLAVVLPANTASRKTLERIGMLLKSALADVPGQPPSLVYELTAARYAGLPKTPPPPTPFGA